MRINRLTGQTRSAIPCTLGVLACFFAPIGLAIAYQSGTIEIRRVAAGGFGDAAELWAQLWLWCSVGLFALHLFGGIFALVYRAIGLRLLTAYAVLAVLLVLVDLVMMQYVPFAHDRHGLGRMFHTLGAFGHLIWPAIVLVLANVQRARAACR